ncbi:hypothetical protein ACFOY2_46285 [Nonomuraea purpurea]|uniref:Fibronectin type-III domain-containing protein n=1 Tax=Nonomuraea purpurea TaxID=1849276 RepID=A0ABV8GL94_9ACTN
MAEISEDFEDEAYNLAITGTWTRSDTAAQAGSWSLRSPINTTNNTTYDANIAIPPGATSVTFYYRVSSEATYDVYNTLLDGVTVTALSQKSGEVPWTPSGALNVTGKTTLTFRYVKDVSDKAGADGAWVDNIVFTVPTADTTPPTVPANLRSTRASATRISFAWDASTDSMGVTGYNVYRDGVLIGYTPVTAYDDAGRTPATSYTYTVRARDGFGNLSAPSSPLTVVTAAPGSGPAEIRVDASSPPLVAANMSALTTAQFTPPPNALLVALSGFSGGQTTAITNTGPSLGWGKYESRSGDGTGAERGTSTVAVARVTSSAPMTVTATSGTSGDSGGLLVLVLTGVDPDGAVGAVGKVKVTGGTTFTADLHTSTADGSRAFVSFYNWNIDANGVDASAVGIPYSGNRGSGIAAYKVDATEAEDTPVQLTFTAAEVGLRGNIVAVEILPAASSGPATVIRGWGPLPIR